MQFVKFLGFDAVKWLMLLTVFIAPSALASAEGHESIRTGTVLFKINQNVQADELKGLNALLKSQGLVKQSTLNGSQITIATFQDHGRETAIAKILKHSGYVDFAEPDYALPPSLQANDPDFALQWHHNNAKTALAWDVTTGSNSVLVAVCDTGFDVNHPDLAANLRTDLAFNAQDGSNYIHDANGHGTGTAGTLGAVGNNATGVAGVNWHVDIIPVRIAISDSNSSAYISTMATCIEYAADNGARVVNLSYGGIQYSTIDAAAQYLRARNGLLFMSAGNDGQEFASYPDYTSFLGVAATDKNDNRASFSNWGSFVDITAPGVSIRTTYKNGQYVYYSGTSFSSPLVAGVAALMVAANPAITVSELENGLFSTATDIGAAGDDNVYGHGLVNAQAAVNYALNLGSSVAPVATIDVATNSIPYGTAIELSALSSYDADGSIVSYQWNLGDGTSSNQVELSHLYAAAGTYQVSLTVTDNDGLSGSATQLVQVTNNLPLAVINDLAASYPINQSIAFNASASSDSDGEISDFEWDFGNGATATGETVDYTYTTAGNYKVTLTVTDNAGGIDSATVNIQITDPNVLYAPSNLSAELDGANVSLSWLDNSSNEDHFIVERGAKYRGKLRFEQIATLSADSTTFQDAVPDSGEYSYRVKAVNSYDEAYSATIKVTVDTGGAVPPDPEPGIMSAPTNLSAVQNGAVVELNWQDNASDELGFYIERGVKTKGQIQFFRIGLVSANISSFSDDVSALATGSYGYRVQANKDGAVSNFTNVAELRIK